MQDDVGDETSSDWCRFCGRPRTASPRSAAENPFCNHCLKERVRRAAKRQPVTVRRVGDYLELVRGAFGKRA